MDIDETRAAFHNRGEVPLNTKGYIEFKRARGSERFSIFDIGHDYCVVVIEEDRVSQFAKGLKVKYNKILGKHKTVGLQATVTDIRLFQDGYYHVYFKHFPDRGSWLVEPKIGTRSSKRYCCPVQLAPVCYTDKYKNIMGTANFRILSFSSGGFLLSLDGFSCPFWVEEEFKLKIFLPGVGLITECVRVCYVSQKQSVNGRFELGVQLVNASYKSRQNYMPHQPKYI